MKRFALFVDKESFSIATGFESLNFGYKANYNVSENNSVPGIYLENKKPTISNFVWGLPLQNERHLSFTLQEAQTNTDLYPLLEYKRCLIPASGFYLWKETVDDKHPFYVRRISDPVILLAGLYDNFKEENGHEVHRFCLLEVPSYDLLKPVSPNMPMVIKAEERHAWLGGESPDRFIDTNNPLHLSELMAVRVPELVNDPNTNDPSMIQPIPKLREED